MTSVSQQQRLAAQLVNTEFSKLYAEFVKHHSSNAYAEIIRLIPSIPIALLNGNYSKHYASLIGRCMNALHRCPPSTSSSSSTTTTATHPPELPQHLCSAYAHLFALQSDLPQFLATVAALDSISSSFRTVLASTESLQLTLAGSILARLDQLLPPDASDRASIESQRPAIYSFLLLLAKLDMCPEKPPPQLSCISRAIALLKRCLPSAGCDLRKSLNLVLLMVGSGSSGWSAHLGAWVRRFEAPEAADELQLHTLHTAVQMLHTLRVVGRIRDGREARQVVQFIGGAQAFYAGVSDDAVAAKLPATSHPTCSNCPAANWAAHQSVALAELGAQLMLSLLPVKAAAPEEEAMEDQLALFYPVVLRGCGSARQLRKCPNAEFWLKRAVRWLLAVPSELQRLQPLPQPWIWRYVRACCAGAQLLAGVGSVTDLWPIDALFNWLVMAAPDADATLAVLYMQLSFQLSAANGGGGGATERGVAYVVQQIVQAQARQATIWDPDEYFGGLGWKWCGLEVPRLAKGELWLAVFEGCTLRTNPMSADQRQMLAMRVLDRLTADRPLQALRVSNCFAGYAVAEVVYGGLQKAYAGAKQRQEEFARSADHKRRWYSCVANMEVIEYLHAQQDLRNRILAEPPGAFDFRSASAASGPAASTPAPDISPTPTATGCSIFRKHVNLAAEVRQLRRLQTSIRWYGKFVAKLHGAADHRQRYALEVHVALEALNQLGEQCALHNFRAQAWQAFWLLLQLARRWPDPDAAAQLAQLRAVTHLAWSPADCAPLAEAVAAEAGDQSNAARDAQLAELRQLVELCADQWLPAMIAQYAGLSRRKRGVLLHCLLSVALYHQEQMGGASEARDMLRLAELQLDRLEREFQLPEGNVHRVRYNAVLLKLIVRHRMECPYPPIVFAEQMMRQFGSLHWGVEDGITRLKCYLFDVLEDVRAYCVARHDVNEVVPVVELMLKILAKQGLAAASARMLVVWLQLKLYMERAAEADAVLGLLDDCLGIFDAGPMAKLQWAMGELAVGGAKQQPQGREAETEAVAVGQQKHQLGSPIRKAHQRRVSPIRETAGTGVPCNKYLIANAGACAVTKQPIVQLLLFEAAILYCRTFYIKSEFAIAANMLEQTGQHYGAIIAPANGVTDWAQPGLFGSYADSYAHACSRLYVDWAHSLWRTAQHERAADMLRSALVWWSRTSYPDVAVRKELNVQQMPLLAEMAPAWKTAAMVRKRFVEEPEPATERAIPQPAAAAEVAVTVAVAVATAGKRGRRPRSRSNKPATASGVQQRDKEAFAPLVVVTQPAKASSLPVPVVTAPNRKRPVAQSTSAATAKPTSIAASSSTTSTSSSRSTTNPKDDEPKEAAIYISDSDAEEDGKAAEVRAVRTQPVAQPKQTARMVRQLRLRNVELPAVAGVVAPVERMTRAKRRVPATQLDSAD